MSWAPLVARIQSGDEAAVFELYEAFARGIRWQLGRTIGMRDAADRVHNTFIAVVSAIRAGRLEDPERLPGYIQTIARCQAAEHVSDAVKSRRQHSVDSADLIDRGHNPEEAAIRAESVQRNAYQAGTVDFTAVTSAQALAYSARVNLITSTVNRQTAAVSLIQAIGGRWDTPTTQP